MLEKVQRALDMGKREQAQRQLEQSVRVTLSKLAASHDGRAFVRWIVDQCMLLHSSYPHDHAQAAWTEGKRFVGAEILRQAQAAGVLAAFLMEENNGR